MRERRGRVKIGEGKEVKKEKEEEEIIISQKKLSILLLSIKDNLS